MDKFHEQDSNFRTNQFLNNNAFNRMAYNYQQQDCLMQQHLNQNKNADILDISQLFQITENDNIFINDPLMQNSLNTAKSLEETNLMPSLTDFIFHYPLQNIYQDIDNKKSPIDDFENLKYKQQNSCQIASPENFAFNITSYNSPDSSESTCQSVNSNDVSQNVLNINGKRRKLSNSPCSSNTSEFKQDGFQDDRPKSISFSQWKNESWAEIYDANYNKIDPPEFKVEADKGFFFSKFDDSFVCQKKNHFQITTHTTLKKEPVYCRFDKRFFTIDKIQLQIYGMKMESHLQKIEIKQSDTDRKQMEYQPVEFRFKANQVTKTTKMRLHFAHTTSNNNRKRNLPNPDQRYFLLVVEMQITLKEINKIVTLCSCISERVIVRAVNPGQFRSQEPIEQTQNKEITSKTEQTEEQTIIEKNLCLYANMGIKTSQLDEALNVVGNIKLTGNLLQPSDKRVKENIQEINPKIALDNISKLKLYQYDYKPEFLDLNGGVKSDFGLMAQELKEILPDAVVESGDLVLTNGELVNGFLHVNKNRLHMECVGAVIALNDKTQNLDDKIICIERILVDPSQKKTSLENPQVKFNKRLNKCVRNADNSMFKFIKTRIFKITVTVCLLTIALAIAGILTVQILQHIRLNDNHTNLNNSSYPSKLNTFNNYPTIVNPMQLISTKCVKDSNNSCSFCCDSITLSSSPRPNPYIPVKLSEKVLNINFTEKYNKTSSSPLLEITLYSNTASVYLNLSYYGECKNLYCEEIDGDDYYYIPIHKSVRVNSNPFFLIFYLKMGYNLTFCKNQDTDIVCADLAEEIFDLISIKNTSMTHLVTRKNYTNTMQLVYYLPITHFLHTDYKFRLTNSLSYSGSSDHCSMTNKSFKDYVFRFYRNCN